MKEFEEFVNKNNDNVTKSKSKDVNGLVFAFVGDAVFSLFVRGWLASESTCKAGVLHGRATKFVRASFQSELLELLWDRLTSEEQKVAINARNQKTNNVAKNSNLSEYKKSTSFEAVLGYLYLTKQTERLYDLLAKCKIEMKKVLTEQQNTKGKK